MASYTENAVPAVRCCALAKCSDVLAVSIQLAGAAHTHTHVSGAWQEADTHAALVAVALRDDDSSDIRLSQGQTPASLRVVVYADLVGGIDIV